ncbi:MAG: hypothetical protein M5R36_10710 [Deltaproteobacteria bacterium]|nr:hypothetical protein [Deltaproteobacteria bacterium]
MVGEPTVGQNGNGKAPGGPRKLGELLLHVGLIKDHELKAALVDQRTFGGKLGSHLVRMGYIEEEKLLEAIAHQLDIPRINLRRSHIRVDALRSVAPDICRKYTLIPVSRKLKNGAAKLLIAMADPTDLDAVHTVEFVSNCQVAVSVAPEADLLRVIEFCYPDGKLRECRGEEDLASHFSIDLPAPADLGEFVVMRADGDERPLRGPDQRQSRELRTLVELLIRKKIITREEFRDLLDTQRD